MKKGVLRKPGVITGMVQQSHLSLVRRRQVCLHAALQAQKDFRFNHAAKMSPASVQRMLNRRKGCGVSHLAIPCSIRICVFDG